MAQMLSQIFTALVQFGIPPKDCEDFVLNLTKDSTHAQIARNAFLVKYKAQIEAGTTVFSGQIGQGL